MANTRRGFLQALAAIAGGAIALPIMAGIVQYIQPVEGREPVRQTTMLDGAAAFAPGSARVIAFNREPVVVIRLANGQFKAFSARCTHLGCVVQFKGGDDPHFACNCHGSQFDINGRNIAGPAPRPLPPYRVSLNKDSLLISKT